MESVRCFLRDLFIIIALFICIVVEVKALIWVTKKFCGYAQYIQCVFESLVANTAAMKLMEPAVMIGVKEPVTSENDKSGQDDKAKQNMKSKKSFKEKQKILANEATIKGRLPVPLIVSAMTQKSRTDGGISNMNNFHRIKVAPCLTHTLWPRCSDFKNQKRTSGSQERNNVTINNRLSMTQRPLEDKTKKVAPNRNSTCTLWPVSSSTKNPNGNNCGVGRNKGKINMHLTMKLSPIEEQILGDDRFSKTEVTTIASSTRCPVRLWSVDTDVGKVTLEGDNVKEKPANSEIISVPRTINSKSNPTTANNETSPRSREISSGSSKFSLILIAVAAVMVRMVMGVVQLVCVYVKRQWAAYLKTQFNLFTDVAGITYSEFTASLSTAPWSRVRVFYGHMKHAIQTFCGYTIIATAAMKSKVATLFSYEHLNIIFGERGDRSVAGEQVSHTFSSKDRQRGKNVNVYDSTQGVASETKADHSGDTKPSTVNAEEALLTSNQARLSQLTDESLNASREKDNSPASQNTGIDIYPQTKASWGCETRGKDSGSRRKKKDTNVLPTVDHAHMTPASEKQGKLFNIRKVKKQVASTISSSKVDEFGKTPLRKERNQKKVLTPTLVEPPATTTCKVKQKTMPRLIPRSCVNTAARAKASVQVKKGSPKVGISNLIVSTKVRNVPQTSCSHNNVNSPPAEGEDAIERTGFTAKRGHNEQGMMYSDKQAFATTISEQKMNSAVRRAHTESIPENPPESENVTPSTLGSTRTNIKRKAGGDQTVRSKYEPTLPEPAQQTARVVTPTSVKATMEQMEMMEVGESADKPLIVQPETMEVNNEASDAREISFEEPRAAYYELQASATTNLTKPVATKDELKTKAAEEEEMEIAQEHVSSWSLFPFSLPSFLKPPFTSQPTEEEMELTQEQVSSWNLFPFSLPSFLKTPFTSQPVEEEMEVTEEQVSSCNGYSLSMPSFLKTPFTAQPADEEMEVDHQLATVTPLKTELDRMEINQQPFAEAAPFGQPVVTVGITRPQTACTLPRQETMKMSRQLFDGCRAVASPFRELTDAKRPMASTVGLFGEAAMPVKIPFANQPALQQAMQRPEILHPVLQSVMQPQVQQIINPIIHSGTLYRPQVNPDLESILNNSRSVAQRGLRETVTTENTLLPSEKREQDAAPKSANQLIMEQLQLVPSADPACLADVSDSESDDDSDEEYELDLETIEKFSELESSSDHAQLITRLLMEKEATQWHRDHRDSDSDSDSDCGDKYELSELLDHENIEKYSELEDVLQISPEQAERLVQSLGKKESCERHNVSDAHFDDESDDNIDLIEHLDLKTIAHIPDLEDVLESPPEDVKLLVKMLEDNISTMQRVT